MRMAKFYFDRVVVFAACIGFCMLVYFVTWVIAMIRIHF